MTNHRRYRLNPDAIHAIKELQKQNRANSLHDPGFDEALSLIPNRTLYSPELKRKLER